MQCEDPYDFESACNGYVRNCQQLKDLYAVSVPGVAEFQCKEFPAEGGQERVSERAILGIIVAAIVMPVKWALCFIWRKSNEPPELPEVWLKWCAPQSPTAERRCLFWRSGARR